MPTQLVYTSNGWVPVENMFDDLIPASQPQAKLVGKATGKTDIWSGYPDATNAPASGWDAYPDAKPGMFDDILVPSDWRPVEQASFNDRFNALPKPKPGYGDTAFDIAKQLPSGVAEGIASIPATVPMLAQLVGRVVDWLSDKTGLNFVDKEKEQQEAALGDQLSSFTPQAQLSGILPQPETKAGEAARLVGNFLPAAAGSSGTLARNLVAGTGAGLGAYEAGQLAPEGYKELAEIPGAIVGGVGASGVARLASAGRRLLGPAVPTADQLDAAKTALYNSPAIKDLRLKPEAISQLTDDIQSQLLDKKIDPNNAPNVMSTLNTLKSGARFESPTTQTSTVLSGPGYHIADDVQKPAAYQVSDLDLARQSLSDVPFEQRRAAGVARSAIDSYLGAIPQSDVLAGDASAANADLLAARGNTAALKRSTDITNAMGRAENQAASTYSGGNLENATRQQLRPILNQKTGVAKQQGFQDYTNQEIQTLRNAVNPGLLGNAIRAGGKLLGSGHGTSASLSAFMGYEGAREAGYDPITAAAMGVGGAVVGGGLAHLGASLETRRANALAEMLRARSPLAQARGVPVGGYYNTNQVGQLSPLLMQALAPFLRQQTQ